MGPHRGANFSQQTVFSITSVDRFWNVMAHAQKTNFVFQRNGRVHFNRRGASVQSTTGSRGVRISGSNAGYTIFQGSVKSIGYPLHSPVSPSLPLPCVTVCHHISTGLYNAKRLSIRNFTVCVLVLGTTSFGAWNGCNGWTKTLFNMTLNNCDIDIDITSNFLASKYCFYIFKDVEKQTFLPWRKNWYSNNIKNLNVSKF
jgi:hypothetical protein